MLEIDLLSNGYSTSSQVNVAQGMGYGGATTTGVGTFSIPGLNSLSGVPVTVDLATTYLNLGVDPSNAGNNLWELTNIGTISAGGVTQDIDLTSTGSIFSAWDPINNPLTVQLGITPGFFAGGSGNGGDGFLTPPATVDISSLDIAVTTPEPSVSALMLGGAALLIVITLRRKTA